MSKSGGERRASFGAAARSLLVIGGGVAALWLGLVAGAQESPPRPTPGSTGPVEPAPAIPEPPAADPAISAFALIKDAPISGIELQPAARQTLGLIRVQWDQWLAAFYQSRPEEAERAVNELLVSARQVGMRQLPDLALGALTRAVEVAREGDIERSRWALEAAERLDPGRPEAAFAAVIVERKAGRWLPAAGAVARGYLRLLTAPSMRRLSLHSLARFLLCVVLGAGVLFVAVQMAIKGGALSGDLARFVQGWLPGGSVTEMVAHLLALALLVWPILLPAGMLWLLVYWTVLLWGYCTGSERMVLVFFWLFAGLTPILLAEQRVRVASELSPPERAMTALEGERLYGELFVDLGALPSLFPEHPAVRQLQADLHRRLDDWSAARRRYVQVLEAEPDNAAALTGLGAYYFFQEDFGSAIRLFSEATEADPESAPAFFDLWQAYSESYHFDEASLALSQARALAPSQVSRWVDRATNERLQVPDGGVERIPELRRELVTAVRQHAAAHGDLAAARHWAGLLVAVGVLLAALALHLLRRPYGYSRPGAGLGRRAEWWIRVLVPGYAAAEEERGVAAALGLLPLAALLLLPLAPLLGYRQPVVFSPGLGPLLAVAVAGLTILYGLRVWGELRS